MDSLLLKERFKDIIQSVLHKLGITDVEILVEEEVDGFRAEITTPDSALLIGWRGSSLAALEYLIRALVAREFEGTGDGRLPEVHLDVAGYKHRQSQELAAKATALAEKVRQSGQSTVLPPMNSFERRVVHVALKDIVDIETESIGENPHRRIMIKPKGK